MPTSVGFNPYLQTTSALEDAFPVKAIGWGSTHWDCDLIYDDSDRTSCVRIRRYARITPYGTTKVIREGVEVCLYLNKPDATRDELEWALIRACRELDIERWSKSPWIGKDEGHSFPGEHYEILWK